MCACFCRRSDEFGTPELGIRFLYKSGLHERQTDRIAAPLTIPHSLHRHDSDLVRPPLSHCLHCRLAVSVKCVDRPTFCYRISDGLLSRAACCCAPGANVSEMFHKRPARLDSLRRQHFRKPCLSQRTHGTCSAFCAPHPHRIERPRWIFCHSRRRRQRPQFSHRATETEEPRRCGTCCEPHIIATEFRVPPQQNSFSDDAAFAVRIPGTSVHSGTISVRRAALAAWQVRTRIRISCLR